MPNPVPESTRPLVPERPMRPMDPAELISKAEELFATFEPAKMSLDAHADAKLEEWRVRDPDDAVFLRQVLYGVTRYARFLGVVVRAFMHHNAATVLRRDKNTYTMYAYLALLRLDELGFQQFRCAFGRMVPPRARMLFRPRRLRRTGCEISNSPRVTREPTSAWRQPSPPRSPHLRRHPRALSLTL